jgi:hypothetical protein
MIRIRIRKKMSKMKKCTATIGVLEEEKEYNK